MEAIERSDYLQNTWYVAMWSADLLPETVVARTIVDIPIVFWRTPDGTPGALFDRCAHRAAPLSMGQVRGNGIQCRYHGLQYDASGKCIFNPHPNGAVPPGMQVRAFPLVERYSILWIWIGSADPTPETIPDYSVLDEAPESQVSKRDYLLMKANIELIADNLLDLSHASFLHEGVLGNEQMVDAKTEVEQTGNRIRVSRFFRDVPVPGLFDLMFRRDGANVDHWTRMSHERRRRLRARGRAQSWNRTIRDPSAYARVNDDDALPFLRSSPECRRGQAR
jgi:phenylpropionate dioxygenase-like ring-hydroxylating dioxygenase large terminal subunit